MAAAEVFGAGPSLMSAELLAQSAKREKAVGLSPADRASDDVERAAAEAIGMRTAAGVASTLQGMKLRQRSMDLQSDMMDLQRSKLEHAMTLAEKNFQFQKEQIANVNERDRRVLEHTIRRDAFRDRLMLQAMYQRTHLAAYQSIMQQRYLKHDLRVKEQMYAGRKEQEAKKLASMEFLGNLALRKSNADELIKGAMEAADTKILGGLKLLTGQGYTKETLPDDAMEQGSRMIAEGIEGVRAAYENVFIGIEDDDMRKVLAGQLETGWHVFAKNIEAKVHAAAANVDAEVLVWGGGGRVGTVARGIENIPIVGGLLAGIGKAAYTAGTVVGGEGETPEMRAARYARGWAEIATRKLNSSDVTVQYHRITGFGPAEIGEGRTLFNRYTMAQYEPLPSIDFPGLPERPTWERIEEERRAMFGPGVGGW